MTWTPHVDQRSPAVYLGIADAIEADIRGGALAPGARIPAQRELAATLGVNLTTVTRALTEVRRRGLVSARAGRGTFVRGVDRRMPHDRERDATIDLSCNQTPALRDPDVAAMLGEALTAIARDRGALDRALRYPYPYDPERPEETGAAAVWLAERGMEADPDRIVLTAGMQHGLTIALPAVASPGDVVLTEAVTYGGLRSASALLGLRLEGVPIDEHGILPDAFQSACRRLRPKALVCGPTLQNPTTAILPLARREALVEVAARHGVMILEDDAYGYLPASAPPPLVTLAPDRVIYLTGLSKSVASGLRTGYVLAPSAELAERMQEHVRASVLTVAPLLAQIAARWIHDGTARRIRDAQRAELAARNTVARHALEGASVAAHPASPHLWLRLPSAWSRAAYVDAARRRGVLITSAEVFTASGDPPNAVRICLGAARDLAQLTAALSELQRLLQQPASMSAPLA